MSTTEFTKGETCTASIDMLNSIGDRLMESLCVGFYAGAENLDEVEVWIDQGGHRVKLPAAQLPALIKQLKRAQKLAEETLQ